ncbi:hypothetical protein EV2_042975 [Malus domestica]
MIHPIRDGIVQKEQSSHSTPSAALRRGLPPKPQAENPSLAFFQLGLPLRSPAQLSFLGFLPVLQFYTNQFHNLVESQEQHSTKAPFFIALRDITTSTESGFTTSSREAPGSGLRILGTF